MNETLSDWWSRRHASFMGEACDPLAVWQPSTAVFIASVFGVSPPGGWAYIGERCVSATLAATTLLIYGVLLVLGLVGNASTCAVIWRTRQMHTATNYYFFSLAVSDALMLASGLPFEFAQVMGPLYPYEGTNALCVFKAFTIEWTGYASVLTITAFSCERWMAICFPMKMQLFSKFTRAIKIIVAIWIVSAVAASPVLALVHVHDGIPATFAINSTRSISDMFHENETFFVEASNTTFIVGTRYCAIDASRVGSHILIYTAFTAFFLVPLSTISLLYAHILWVTRGSASVHKSTDVANLARVRKTRKSLIRMLMVVVLAFFVCWLPYHLQRIIAMSEYLQSIPELNKLCRALFYVSGYFYYANSAVNPVIYNILSKRFRLAFLRLMCPTRLASSLNLRLTDTPFLTGNGLGNSQATRSGRAPPSHTSTRSMHHGRTVGSTASNRTSTSIRSQTSQQQQPLMATTTNGEVSPLRRQALTNQRVPTRRRCSATTQDARYRVPLVNTAHPLVHDEALEETTVVFRNANTRL